MPHDKPLLMATCSECRGKYFFERPPGAGWRGIAQIATFSDAPGEQENREVVPFSCPKCRASQFIEVRYEA